MSLKTTYPKKVFPDNLSDLPVQTYKNCVPYIHFNSKVYRVVKLSYYEVILVPVISLHDEYMKAKGRQRVKPGKEWNTL